MKLDEKKRQTLVVNDLAFESRQSFVRALRVPVDAFDHAIDLCENDDPYERWYEPKRSGGQRLIEHPIPPLKKVQSRLNRLLQRVRLPRVFHGSYSRTSILSNAKPHCYSSWFLTFDLANYYKSIRPEKVYTSLRQLNASPDVARLITRLSTISGRVPQGAPTSPMIAAIAMLRLSRRLSTLCANVGGQVTIYGDNVCISGPRTIVGMKSTFFRIATTEGFRVRSPKTVITEPGQDKPLPGLAIRNSKPAIYDRDLAAVQEAVERCVHLGKDGLARRVCPRYVSHLRGVVKHYSWIDDVAMTIVLTDFRRVEWPDSYVKSACETQTCYCRVG